VAGADPSPQAATWAANHYDVPVYEAYEDLLRNETLDALVIAAPTRVHCPLAVAALERGVDVLVEKPIASDVKEAWQMVDTARAAGRILAVGHVERFNPVVRELRRRLESHEVGRVLQVHARRLGPFPARIRDVGAVIDLATHDLDIMCFLLEADVTRLYAETERRLHTSHEDMVSAVLRFEDGVVGLLDVNWLTPTKVRDVRVLGERGMLHADYLTQSLTLYRNSVMAGPPELEPGFTGVGEGEVVRLEVARSEPLRSELEAFLSSVESRCPPEVDGEQAIRALRLATQLVDSGRLACAIDARAPVLVGG
jgi:predicted dehydrogenase